MELLLDKNNIWTKIERVEISYPDEGLDNLNEIEDKSFWFSHRNKIIVEVIKRFPFQNDFADIGGGNGFQLKTISENINGDSKYILIEPGYNGCLRAHHKGIKYIFNIQFGDFPFNQYKIGAVSLFDVIEHIQDDVSFLNELKAKLNKGTKIYITAPSHNFLRSDVDDYGGHFRRYNSRMIQKLSENTKMKLLFWSYFFSYLVPASFLLRALPYKCGVRRTKDKILKSEFAEHQPQYLVKQIFNFLEKGELQKVSTSAIKSGASCIFVFQC